MKKSETAGGSLGRWHGQDSAGVGAQVVEELRAFEFAAISAGEGGNDAPEAGDFPCGQEWQQGIADGASWQIGFDSCGHAALLLGWANGGDKGIGDALDGAQGRFNFGGVEALAGEFEQFARATGEYQIAVGIDIAAIGHEATCYGTVAARVMAAEDGGAADADPPVSVPGDGHLRHGFADGGAGEGEVTGWIKGDAAGFGGAVEVVDALVEAGMKLLRLIGSNGAAG